MESVERQTGIRDPQLNTTDIPPGFEVWFHRFMEIRRGDLITFADIKAYEDVVGIKLTPVEISAILAMDKAASSAIAEIMKEGANTPGS